jgi:hypothetical protein
LNTTPYSEKLLVQALGVVLCSGIVFKQNARPRFLKNPATGTNLELDVYLPKLRLAFEVQGPQHRKDAQQVARDALKAGLAEARGVKVIPLRLDELRADGVWRCLHARAREIGVSPWKVVQPLGFIREGMQLQHEAATKYTAHLLEKYGPLEV